MIKSDTEKVLFKDIIRSCSFKKVKDTLLRLYPDQKKLVNGYKYVFKTLKLMRPRYSKEGMIIDIEKVGKGKNAYFSVSGACTQKGIKQLYAIEYTPWSEWLGCEVDRKVLRKMLREEIAAHCLWEMTFAGFTQDKIRREINILRKRVKDIKEGKVKMIPHEEVMKMLKDKIGKVKRVKPLYFISMARQPKSEYEGAFYHVTSRGNQRKKIFFDDRDRRNLKINKALSLKEE